MQLHFGKIFQKTSKYNIGDTILNHPAQGALTRVTQNEVKFKEYSRHIQIQLPAPVLEIAFVEAVKQRSTTTVWNNESITLEQLSNLLYYSCGSINKALDKNLSRRAQMSIGQRYPLEVYIVNFTEGDLKRYVYHYRPEDHTLDQLWTLDFFEPTKLENLFTKPQTQIPACAIFITGVTNRIVPLYKDRAYRYMYLEAGAIANTLNIIGSIGSLGSIVYENINDEIAEEILDIDGEYETLCATVFIGNKK